MSMFGQPSQQQPSGGLFGTAPQLGQTTGGFTFGSGSTSNAPSVGAGFNFSATSATTQQPAGFSFGSNGTKSAAVPGSTGSLSFGPIPGGTGSLTQPAGAGLNLGAKPVAQAGGFSFGSTTPGSSFQFGKSAGTTASTPQIGGFAFGSVAPSVASFGTPAMQPSQATSSGLKLGSTGGPGLGFGSQAPTAAPAAPGGISLASGTTSATSSPFTGGLTLGKASAGTGTLLGGGLAQPTGLSGSMFSTPNTQTVGLGLGSTPSQGFALGTGKTTAPATSNPTPAFTPGGATAATSSASSGFSLGSGSGGGNPSSGLKLGVTPATTAASGLSLGGGFKLSGTTASPASAGFTLGIPAGTASSATPATGASSGSAKTTVATTTTTTTSTGLTLGSTGTTTAPGFSFPATSGIKLGTTQTTTSLSTATTTVAAGTGTIASAASAPSTSAAGASAATSSAPQLTYKQLEEHINKWAQELADYERTFLDQAAQVNSWDRLLMENGEKITELNAGVENVKAEQKRLDQELDFIMAQQQELEEMLKPLEEAVSASTSGSRQLQQADKERDFTYKLAKDIDGQLKQMVHDLKTIIDHLNTSNTQQQDTDDPIAQIAKILNAHMNSLQWIDQNSGILQRKVDEIARLSETRRKEQERNFRLAFD